MSTRLTANGYHQIGSDYGWNVRIGYDITGWFLFGFFFEVRKEYRTRWWGINFLCFYIELNDDTANALYKDNPEGIIVSRSVVEDEKFRQMMLENDALPPVTFDQVNDLRDAVDTHIVNKYTPMDSGEFNK